MHIYCWGNPFGFVDLNGMTPIKLLEGKEAHTLLQSHLMKTVPGVECEVSIPYSSINGNTGSADIVYKHDGIVEIYEIKSGLYSVKNTSYHTNAEQQLMRYIENYHFKDKGYNGVAVKGISLNNEIQIYQAKSQLHKDKMIRYYTYPSDPVMVYWGYVNIPNSKVIPKRKINEIKTKNEKQEEDVVDDIEKAAMVTTALLVVYEIIKWGIAIFLAPETGGGSLWTASCLP